MPPVTAPVFVVGTARSGSTLLAKMLDAHPEVALAADPFFPLFKLLRNAVVDRDPALVGAGLDPNRPLEDAYFDDLRLAVLDAVVGADLDMPCDLAAWEATFEVRRLRLSHECPDLVPLLPQMRGETFRELLEAGLGLIARGRGKGGLVGIKEVWLVEFLLPLLRAWPGARCVVVTRDPRGVIASMRSLPDPSARAHTLSYLRHWRKSAAFLFQFEHEGLLGRSILHVRYEDLLADPQSLCRDLCRFLGVPEDPAMLDPGRQLDYATGRPWQGNASDGTPLIGISPRGIDRWKAALPPAVVALCEFAVGPDMAALGYKPVFPPGNGFPFADALSEALADNERVHNWRTDFGDTQTDMGLESYRRQLLTLPEDWPDGRDIRRSFLFKAAWRSMRAGRRLAAETGCGRHP